MTTAAMYVMRRRVLGPDSIRWWTVAGGSALGPGGCPVWHARLSGLEACARARRNVHARVMLIVSWPAKREVFSRSQASLTRVGVSEDTSCKLRDGDSVRML